MSKTVSALFDGQVLRFDEPLDLEPNTRYKITIEPETDDVRDADAWDVLERFAGSVDAPPYWASEHDHYLYGTPKRQAENSL
ncbi:MAG TPA: antitoxin family protein [Chloroflexia bacterium]